MSMLRTSLVLLALCVLAGCASMNEQACLSADWATIGFEDGAAGRAEGSISGHRQACARHGVAPDLDQYRAGHAEGVEIYCRPARGFDAGHSGARYQGVCPARLEGDFLAAFNSGRTLRELEMALRGIDNQIASNARLRASIQEELTAIAASVAGGETTTEERITLVARAAELGAKYGELGSETESLREERALREHELEAYRNTLAFDF